MDSCAAGIFPPIPGQKTSSAGLSLTLKWVREEEEKKNRTHKV